jgi:Outer membrane protein beta-barrel domain
MKRMLAVGLFVLGTTGVVRAQAEFPAPQALAPQARHPQPGDPQASDNVALDFSRTSASSQAAVSPSDSLWAFTVSSRSPDPFASAAMEPFPLAPSLASPAYPPAAPSPVPRVKDTGRDYRWQIGLGVALVRFRSSVYYATAVGLNTSVSYFFNDSLAIEGAVTSAFAPAVFESYERVKYVGYGAGPKYYFMRDKFQPWVHAIVGGMHILPQTALGSQNGFEVLVGGGLDYSLNPNWALRLEGDYVRTHVFGQSQNNGQAVLGIVYRF